MKIRNGLLTHGIYEDSEWYVTVISADLTIRNWSFKLYRKLMKFWGSEGTQRTDVEGLFDIFFKLVILMLTFF